ncbi:Protein kinase domain/Protein tyrosine kinase, putative [Angomonas deanei]|uniref:Protein kinase domain/Protein tyrosine kinase, putative n=1 Tax=Angomonas deanei TaxID=59799 RepID=A0A7G2CPP2_9TRYP|nr:Protein kinase domain/Protein tyrosine kinase, putative [Angomonas deanei]
MSTSKGEYLDVRPGDVIKNRYKIVEEIGSGNFSRVYRAYDLQNPVEIQKDCPVAVKVLKREYKNDAYFEKRMLKILQEKDVNQSLRVSKMFEYFEYKEYPVFVMPVHGESLRSRELGFQNGLVTRDKLILFAYDFLETMQFIHFHCSIVHTDLKPENILLASENTPKNSIGNRWIVCDFGSASQWRMDSLDSDLISTRPYRAPEVVMGNKWHYAADMWSVGCILYEVAAGHRLFEVRDDNTHLQLMEKRIGKLPEYITRRSKDSSKYFNSRGEFLVKSDRLNSSKIEKTPLREYFKDDPQLLSLLMSMFIYDPNKRVTASKALLHPIFDAIRTQNRNDEHKTTNVSDGKPSRKTAVIRKEVPSIRVEPPTHILSGENEETSNTTNRELQLPSMTSSPPPPLKHGTPDSLSPLPTTNQKTDPSSEAPSLSSSQYIHAVVENKYVVNSYNNNLMSKLKEVAPPAVLAALSR